MSSPRRPAATLCATIAVAVWTLAATGAALAIQPPDTPLVDLVVREPGVYVANVVQPVSALSPTLAAQAKLELAALGAKSTSGFYDLRGGRWGTLLLRKPLVPGSGVGNTLTWSGLGVSAPRNDEQLRDAVWLQLRRYLTAQRAQLRVDPAELSSRPSIAIHDGGQLIQVHAARMAGGVPVRDSFLTAVVKRGNLILLGTRNWGDLTTSAGAVLTAQQAEEVVGAHVRPLSSV